MKTPILQTERLILRPIKIEDAPDVQRHFNNWDIIKYISNAPWPYPEDGAFTYIRGTLLPEIARGQGHVWALTLKDGDGKLIGMINYRLIAGEDNDNRGFWLAVPYHGQGLMTEAVCRINDFVFHDLGVERFRTRNVKGNIGSHRIKAKTGGILIGECEEKMANGHSEIMELWEITHESWKQAKEQFLF